MKNKLLLLSATILMAVSPVLAGNVHPTEKTSITATQSVISGITLKEVQIYMSGFGINIIGISTILGSENVYARDDKGFNYIIYVNNGIIDGWDHIDI